ncbi:hypothetical protein LJB95_01220 [Paludibacteraceae bacterium OttesenSCG-928-F17]|nr:hypothetical protein [Paludibacteraceae bacterium OttesenSCG-928-F17]
MNKIFFYKEWIKTRYYFVVAFIVTLCFCVYCILNISRIIELKGAVHIWEVMLQRDAIFIQQLRFIPLIIGILAGVMQFIPEMQQKRIKLTLHLPCSYYRSIGIMLLFGVCMLIVIFVCNFLFLSIALSQYFAVEMVRHILLTAFVWYLAGVLAYFFSAWICIEPTWKRRVLNTLIAVAVLRILFLSETPEAYNSFLPILVIYTVLASVLPFLSIVRFKTGKQD